MRCSLKQTLDGLNDLVRACAVAERGFERAAAHARSPSVQSDLTRFAIQRRNFGAQLAAEVRRLGGLPAVAHPAAGPRAEAWEGIRTAVQGDANLLAACERGERATRERYEHALEGELPAETRHLLLAQARLIRRTLASLRTGHVLLSA